MEKNTSDIGIKFLLKMIGVSKENCIEWKHRLSTSGYSTLCDTRVKPHRIVFAHRISYEVFNGPIPEGMVIDHVCRNRKCVNPFHLRCVDIATNNIENSNSPTAINHRKTHCIHGHPFDEENTIVEYGKSNNKMRRCKECYVRKYTMKNRKRDELARINKINNKKS